MERDPTPAACGLLLPLLLAVGTVAGAPGLAGPAWKGCADGLSKALPYCDTRLSIGERVAALVANLTLDEKIAFISPQPQIGADTCSDFTAGKPSIGLPDYMWLTEANSMVAAHCYSEPWRCPTSFIGPLGTASSFNRSSWRLKGAVIGTEMRAINNLAWHRGDSYRLIGLTAFGPNINIARDPRWGRTSEVPGEDPFLSGTYAAEMVSGMQEEDEQGHPKALAFLKHFTAYSVEVGRGQDTYQISMHDLWETYLAQFEIAFKQGKPAGAMCSYNGINGHPACANGYILNEVIRGKWGQKDAFVTTDCGAVSNLMGSPVHAASPELAAAYALMNGTDLEMGSTVWTQHLRKAIDQGLATEAAVTAAATRGFLHHFRAGRFDPPEKIGWSSLGAHDINSTQAQRASWETALQGMVLLKNEGGLLPLRRGARLAVVGPMGVDQDLMEDYGGATGEGGCWPNSDEKCIITIGQAIVDANAAGATAMSAGVDVNSNRTTGIAAALELVRRAEIAVLVLGNDRTQEHEGIDRTDIGLPGLQETFAKQVLALGKPTLLILSNGGALAIDDLVAPCTAIVEAFNPTQRADALAHLLFGRENRWGKLPYTIYPKAYTKEQPMTNFDMSRPPGRTYKYYTGKALFEFGHGLSLTTFALQCHQKPTAASGEGLSFTCVVRNTGALDGDEVVMVYHSAGEAIRSKVDHPVPIKALVGFERVRVAAGAAKAVSFSFGEDVLKLVDGRGERVLYGGERRLIFSNGAGQAIEMPVLVPGLRAGDGAVQTFV